MNKWLSALRLPATLPVLDATSGYTRFIVGATAGYLALGILAFAAWRYTGNIAFVQDFFKVPGALMLLLFAAIELIFSRRVVQEFSEGQPMQTAWRWISFSAGFNLAGTILVQVLGSKVLINPFLYSPWWLEFGGSIRQVGQIMGGSCRFLLLAIGLFWALKAYRQSGFLGRWSWTDWALILLVGAFVVRETSDVIGLLRGGHRPPPGVYLGWPAEPLLWILIAEALLLKRSVRLMGAGWIGRCWKSFSTAILLVTFGDVMIWATGWGHVRTPWDAIGWYAWLPAAAAFALAPIYQLEAIANAKRAGSQAGS